MAQENRWAYATLGRMGLRKLIEAIGRRITLPAQERERRRQLVERILIARGIIPKEIAEKLGIPEIKPVETPEQRFMRQLFRERLRILHDALMDVARTGKEIDKALAKTVAEQLAIDPKIYSLTAQAAREAQQRRLREIAAREKAAARRQKEIREFEEKLRRQREEAERKAEEEKTKLLLESLGFTEKPTITIPKKPTLGVTTTRPSITAEDIFKKFEQTFKTR